MKKIIILSFVSWLTLSVQAAKIFIHQVPTNGGPIQISANVGDTIIFGFPSTYSIRQVTENQNLMAGGYNFEGKGILVFNASGNSYFTVQMPGGSQIKGQINTNPVLKVNPNFKESNLETRLVNGRLQVVLKDQNAIGLIALHDVLGNKIFESPANDNIDWSMAGLKSGVYFLVWKDGRNNQTRRILFRQDN
jgi:hypothetical protein